MTEINATANPLNDSELNILNQQLAHVAYADGFSPSAKDVSLFTSLKTNVGAGSYPHLNRWYLHIASFSEEERKQWGGSTAPSTSAPVPAANADDDFDLFGSDEEDDAEKQRITEERLKAYAEKKTKKPGPIAKSNIIYDVKPWDDTIDTDEIEKAVRTIEMDGLVWGAAKKVPVAFGIVKLQICCVVEDDKVSSDSLEEAITGFEDLVQSVDVVAFNKV